MRINKFIANSGLCSRRKAEELINNGEIYVNGEKLLELSYIVKENDKVTYKDKLISLDEEKVYYILNKPEGYITTSKDQFGRKDVLEFFKDIKERIYPVGRLDFETSGLLILTNDGDLTYKITHPKHEINKVYIASVRGIPSKDEINRFENGLKIDDYITSKSKLRILKSDNIKNYSVCEITIHEGHNRQVRKMLSEINHPVINLKRVKIGLIELGKLEKGKYRKLTNSEIQYLKNL